MFDHKGQIVFDAESCDEATLLEAVLEAGGDDLQKEDDSFVVYTSITDFHSVQDALREQGLKWDDAELAMVPKTMVAIEGAEAQKLLKLLDALDDLDDVQKVYTNADIDEESLVGA